MTKRVNGNGGSNDPLRGAYCTPKEWCDRAGPWDVDPFSNPLSHLVAATACMLERGDDGLAGPRRGEYFVDKTGNVLVPGEQARAISSRGFAGVDTRVWLQPPYEIVDEAIAHYGHARFCALLRFDPSTQWFIKLYRISALVCVPRGKRIEFEPPPGVRASKNPYPHAFYFAREEDATPALLRACVSWRTNSDGQKANANSWYGANGDSRARTSGGSLPRGA